MLGQWTPDTESSHTSAADSVVDMQKDHLSFMSFSITAPPVELL